MKRIGTSSKMMGGVIALFLLPAWAAPAASAPDQRDQFCGSVQGSSAWGWCTVAIAQGCHIDPTTSKCEDRAARYEAMFGTLPPWMGACQGGDGVCTVFITPFVLSANLGGLAGADATCNAQASGAGLEGEYKAWLSDSNASPNTRFSQASVPYELVTGDRIADDWIDRTDGVLSHPIDRTATGGLANGSFSWTGTDEFGDADAVGGTFCADWTSTDPGPAPDSRVGFSGVSDAGWTATEVNAFCNFFGRRLYCFEQ